MLLEQGSAYCIPDPKVSSDITKVVSQQLQAESLVSLFSKYRSNRILVVDDEEFCIASMRTMLERLGIDTMYQVDFCIDGEESFQILKKAYEQGMSYKMVFTDFNMPNVNGIEATKKMRKHLLGRDRPKIIGVTGHISEQFEREGREAGMDRVCAKPLYRREL